MLSKIEILGLYANAFRKMVNEKNWSTDKSVQESLRLTKKSDWSFICTVMDIVGDASLAIDNFLTFSLDGPTKYDDTGEKYLRLYGLLSATYIQQQALYNLYKLNNVPNPKELLKKIKTLKIREVRHKLASHSNDFLNPDTEDLESYIPIRATLMDYNCEFLNNETDEWEQANLKEIIEEHLSLMIEISDLTYEKSIKTFYKGSQKKYNKATELLENLRIMRDGSLVVEGKDGKPKIIINFMQNKTQQGHQD